MPNDDTDRQRRLAEALRANLRRRKGQARERTEGDSGKDKPEPEVNSADKRPR